MKAALTHENRGTTVTFLPIRYLVCALSLAAVLSLAPLAARAADHAFGYKGLAIGDRLDAARLGQYYGQCLKAKLDEANRYLAKEFADISKFDPAIVKERTEGRLRSAREAAYKHAVSADLVFDTINRLNFLEPMQRLIDFINRQDGRSLGEAMQRRRPFTTISGNCADDQDAMYAISTGDGRIFIMDIEVADAGSHAEIRTFMEKKYGQPRSFRPPSQHVKDETFLLWGDDSVMAVLGEYRYRIVNMAQLEQAFRQLAGNAEESGRQQRQNIVDLFE